MSINPNSRLEDEARKRRMYSASGETLEKLQNKDLDKKKTLEAFLKENSFSLKIAEHHDSHIVFVFDSGERKFHGQAFLKEKPKFSFLRMEPKHFTSMHVMEYIKGSPQNLLPFKIEDERFPEMNKVLNKALDFLANDGGQGGGSNGGDDDGPNPLAPGPSHGRNIKLEHLHLAV